MKLTEVERLSLWNQFRILQKLDPQDDSHKKNAEIIRAGYEGLYGQVFEHMYEPTSEAVCKEVYDILDMYRALEAVYGKGMANPKGFNSQFDVFDGNNDEHFSVACFL